MSSVHSNSHVDTDDLDSCSTISPPRAPRLKPQSLLEPFSDEDMMDLTNKSLLVHHSPKEFRELSCKNESTLRSITRPLSVSDQQLFTVSPVDYLLNQSSKHSSWASDATLN